MLLLKRPDFVTADNIQKMLNEKVDADCAAALGAGAVNVVIPDDARKDLVRFIADIQEIEVESDMGSRVVINERTGTIVVGSRVMIKPCQVAHGNLTIKIATTPVVSQPLPDTQGQTVAAVARKNGSLGRRGLPATGAGHVRRRSGRGVKQAEDDAARHDFDFSGVAASGRSRSGLGDHVMLYVNPLDARATSQTFAGRDKAAKERAALQELEHLFLFTMLKEMRRQRKRRNPPTTVRSGKHTTKCLTML